MRPPANRCVGRICVVKSAKFLNCGAVDKISRSFKICIFQTGSAPALRCKIRLRFHAHEPPLGLRKPNCRNLKEAPNFTLSRPRRMDTARVSLAQRLARLRRRCLRRMRRCLSARDERYETQFKRCGKWRRRHTARDGAGDGTAQTRGRSAAMRIDIKWRATQR